MQHIITQRGRVAARGERKTGATGAVATALATGAAWLERSKQSEAASARVQKETTYASTAGQRHDLPPTRAVSRVQMQQLGELQKRGYERAGRLERVKQCGTIPIVASRVALGITERGGITMAGRCMCGSRWCADCWSRIASERGEDVRAVAEWAASKGFQLVLGTFTAAHVKKEVLDECDGDTHQAVMKQNVGEVFDGLAAAWRYVHAGRAGKEIKAQRVGYARGFELTTDALETKQITGTHGHFHVLIIFEKGVDLDTQKAVMWERWQRGCEKQGLKTAARGFDWKVLKVDNSRHISAAASYLVKGEKLSAEKIGGEIAQGNKKAGRGEKRTSPEGLLRAIGALDGEKAQLLGAKAVAQWRGLEEACRGRRWLTWSRDLRKMAGLGEEKSDEEIANTQEEVQGDTMAVVEYDEVKDYIEEIREAVLETKKTAEKWETLLLCLQSLGIAYELTSREEWDRQVKKWIKARRLKE
ncbi:hypothetical protein BA768_20725 [Chryseobacterium sp. CBo1]|uniref:hypothetical protein n=1 Tax=Pseudomonadati TaxID=3379134 RepID=UPI0008104F4F|nr:MULTISPECIES: hypothetical protein [Bacteria]OCK50056.1 hypothetical protein BA768_20725 [Chryseobacterium sp. CBo1]